MASKKECVSIPTKGGAASKAIAEALKWFRGKEGNEAEQIGRSIRNNWDGEYKVAQYRASIRRAEMEQKFTEQQLEDMTFYIDSEKFGNPTHKDKSRAGLIDRLGPEARAYADKHIKELTDNYFAAMVDAGMMKDSQYREHYITHMYAKKNLLPMRKNDVQVAWKNLTTDSRYAKKRRIPTYWQAMEHAGLKPRFTKITDLLGFYENNVLQVLANDALIKELKRPRAELGGEAFMMKTKDAPDHWKAFGPGDHPQFRGNSIVPELMEPLKVVFEWTPQPGAIQIGATRANALMKELSLKSSFFHHISLTESMLQLSGFKGGVKSVKTWGSFMKSLFTGKSKIELPSESNVEDAVYHGLGIGAPTEFNSRFFNKFVQQVGKIPVPGAKGSAKFIEDRYNAAFHEGLWRTMHAEWKVWSWNRSVDKFSRVYEKEISSGEMTLEQVKQYAAAFVNDAFGGQNWNRLMKNGLTKRTKRGLQAFLLAPDWTISNLRVAGKSLGGGASFFVGTKNVPGMDPVQASMGRRYLANTAAIYLTMATAGSYAMTHISHALGFITDDEMDELYKDGFDPFSVTTNEKMRLFGLDAFLPMVGWRVGKDGDRWKWATPLKQVSETMRYFVDPTEVIGSKMSPILKELIKQFTDEDPGGNWPSAWVDEEFFSANSLGARTASVASNFVPLGWRSLIEEAFTGKPGYSTQISVPYLSFLSLLPKRSELSKGTLVTHLKSNISAYAAASMVADGDEKTALISDLEDNIGDIMETARRNGMDSGTIFATVAGDVKDEYLKEFLYALNNGDDEKATNIMGAISSLPGNKRAMKSGLSKRFWNMVKREQVDMDWQEWRKGMNAAMAGYDSKTARETRRWAKKWKRMFKKEDKSRQRDFRGPEAP